MSGQSDNELLQRAKDGDAVALTVLLAKSGNWLCPMIEREIPEDLQSFVSADVVLQETSIAAMRVIRDFDGDSIEQFSAWLKIIAIHRLQDTLREQRRIKRGGGFDQARISSLASALFDSRQITASEVMAADDRSRMIEIALANLQEQWREALLLKYVDDLTVDEVAEAMGVTAGSVRSYLRSGREHLQNLIGSASELLVGKR
ncbi:MAG: sigma-70 family RNA polymerase sigma factor [Planctomycetota bacterium]